MKGRIKKLYVLVVQWTSKRWAVESDVNTATGGDHRVSVSKAGLFIQVKRHLLLGQNTSFQLLNEQNNNNNNTAISID